MRQTLAFLNFKGRFLKIKYQHFFTQLLYLAYDDVHKNGNFRKIADKFPQITVMAFSFLIYVLFMTS